MLKTKTPQTKREDEPRFKAEEEPKDKIPYVTYKNEFYIWDGKNWELLSVRYGIPATGTITLEIAKWMKTKEYQKLRDRKKK